LPRVYSNFHSVRIPLAPIEKCICICKSSTEPRLHRGALATVESSTGGLPTSCFYCPARATTRPHPLRQGAVVNAARRALLHLLAGRHLPCSRRSSISGLSRRRCGEQRPSPARGEAGRRSLRRCVCHTLKFPISGCE
jgi:hypothetical protein